jgi:hypothetical protein
MKIIDLNDPAIVDSRLAELPPLPISALVIAAWNLLEEASDLPQPKYLTVSSTQSMDFQFPADRSSYQSITRWALRFGGVITSDPVPDEGKGPRILCQVEFDYYGIRAEAYAVIPADTTA